MGQVILYISREKKRNVEEVGKRVKGDHGDLRGLALKLFNENPY